MKFTSINISNSEHNFKYIFEYKRNNYFSNDYSYCVHDNYIYICNNDYNNWIRNNNIWSKFNEKTIPLTNVKSSSIILYFPVYSIETYIKSVSYAVTANIWINNKTIYLGTYIVNRSDALAAERVRDFHNQKYYECISFNIPDVWSILYDDEWKDWRVNVCDSKITESYESNNESAILNITLHPVLQSGNIYTKHSEYDGSQNGIKFNEYKSNLHYSLRVNKNRYPCFSFESVVDFNESYAQNVDGLKLYLKETYGINNCIFRYDYYIQDKENVYGYYSKYENGIECELTKYDINDSEYPFSSWDNFCQGLYINSSLNIIDKDNIEDEEGILMTIMSNEIPLNEDLYKFLVKDDSNDVDFVKLNLIDMKVYEINAVNKVEQKIIQVERPTDYKSNLIKPVYYRTRDLGSVIFHPAVTENICINLDSYKSQANSFLLRLEGVNFKEIARVSNGVIFKIVGSMLPAESSNGIYYILNENEELITTGKYTYEM